jgi:small subunit ribosomal protein S6
MTLAKSNVYETLFILDSNKYARDPGGVSGTIPSMVEKLGGEILASRLWNEQKLAYPINGHRKGTYWLAYFRLDSQKLTEFDRQCHLNENILRNLTLVVEPRLVDVLVAHATGVRPATPAPAPPAPATIKAIDEIEVPEEASL